MHFAGADAAGLESHFITPLPCSGVTDNQYQEPDRSLRRDAKTYSSFVRSSVNSTAKPVS
jgi:hypothetical protein